jgi:zinc transport system ATP-binding protein
MDSILKVSHLHIAFGLETVIQDITFEVKERETLVILGPNGAGKTVLLKALLGLLPYQGEVTWRKDVKIGYVPQRVPFEKDLPLTIEEFFGLKGVSREKTAEVLKQVGIED